MHSITTYVYVCTAGTTELQSEDSDDEEGYVITSVDHDQTLPALPCTTEVKHDNNNAYAIIGSDTAHSKQICCPTDHDATVLSSELNTTYYYIKQKPKKCLRPSSASAVVIKGRNFIYW